MAYDQWRRDQEEREKLLNDSQASILSVPPDTQPPVPVSEFLEAEVRKELNEKYLATRRHPGQPILTPELFLNMPISAQIEDQREFNRRREVEKISYFISVRVNGETACKTKHRRLKHDFIVDFQVRYLQHALIACFTTEVYRNSFNLTCVINLNQSCYKFTNPLSIPSY